MNEYPDYIHWFSRLNRISLELPINFEEDGEDVLKVQLLKQFSGDDRLEYYPFLVASWQRDGVRLDALRLKFRSPPITGGFSPAGISLREDAHAHKATLSRHGDDPSTTILELPDTSDIGHGSVSVRLLLAGDRSQDPQELWIRAEGALSSDEILGGDYRASGEFTVEVP